MDETEIALDRMWKGTCKVLFGEEIGDYSEYCTWLSELVDPPVFAKSSISGKEVAYSTKDYPKSAKAISLDEVDFNKKYAEIQETKGVEGIVAGVKDRSYYAGNIILGNSKYVKKSSNISDGFYISNTTVSGNSKYLAFCTLARLDNSCFGSNAFSQSEFCLKCHELTRVKRSLELWMSQDCSDCYYSHGLKNCSNCIFCFNLENKRNCIGNVELSPEKYLLAKKRLLSEMAAMARKGKRLPSLLEIVAKCKLISGEAKAGMVKTGTQAPLDRGKIEKAFAQTYQIIFGALPKQIDFYSAWLLAHTRGFERAKSAASGKEVFLANYGNYSNLPKDRLLTLEEAKEFGKNSKLAAGDAETISIANAHLRIGKIAYFNTDIQDGQDINDIECVINIDAVNSYRTVCCVYSKYCAYSFWPRSCEYLFGCDSVFDSSFCINCYHSVNLRRCLEMDGCNSCSDSYFCHNSENLQDCMFCFNVKNKKHAIGNVEVGKERFMEAKKTMLLSLASSLEASGRAKYDIFSL